MRKDLLIKGAELLEADAANENGMKFSIHDWGYRVEDNTTQKLGLDCGTVGCAMGLFALSGAFESEGLLMPDKNNWRLTPVFLKPGDDVRYGGISAAVFLFEINHKEALWLFMPDSYEGEMTGAVGELKVAKRMRELAAQPEGFDPYSE